jgi:hypothetical protein
MSEYLWPLRMTKSLCISTTVSSLMCLVNPPVFESLRIGPVLIKKSLDSMVDETPGYDTTPLYVPINVGSVSFRIPFPRFVVNDYISPKIEVLTGNCVISTSLRTSGVL